MKLALGLHYTMSAALGNSELSLGHSVFAGFCYAMTLHPFHIQNLQRDIQQKKAGNDFGHCLQRKFYDQEQITRNISGLYRFYRRPIAVLD
jgi:hypothetical protein